MQYKLFPSKYFNFHFKLRPMEQCSWFTYKMSFQLYDCHTKMLSHILHEWYFLQCMYDWVSFKPYCSRETKLYKLFSSYPSLPHMHCSYSMSNMWAWLLCNTLKLIKTRLMWSLYQQNGSLSYMYGWYDMLNLLNWLQN